MSDFRANFSLWKEFLKECEDLIEGEHIWKTIKLNGHPTKQEGNNMIDNLFINNASLPQIVRRHHIYYKQDTI